MTRPAAPGPRRRGRARGSVIAALFFNASLLMLPFAGAALLQTATAGDLIDYAPASVTIKRTQDALAAEARRFAASGDSAARRLRWNNLIAREMAEGDLAAARGFALNADAMLGGGDVSKLRRLAKATAGDRGLLEAALPIIEPPFARQRFRAAISGGGGAFDNLGDARETAAVAQRWLAGETIDLYLFTLGGATLPATEAPIDDVRLGAAVLKIAKTNGKLAPDFAAAMEARLAAAVPPGRLRDELAAAFQNRDVIVDEGATAALAFARARDREAYAALARDLAHIGAAAREATPAGAAQLLAHARSPRDLRRVELLAVATGERAVAIAKRSPQGLVLKSARGAIRWTNDLIIDILVLALALIGVLVSAHIAMLNALRGAWEGDAPRGSAPPISKADAQRRAREGALERA